MKKLISILVGMMLVGVARADEVDDYILVRPVFSNSVVRIASTLPGGSGDVTQAGLAAGSYPMAAGVWLIRAGVRTYYASLTNAVASSVAGDTVELESGFHYVTDRLSPPVNFTIRGSGKDSVIVNGYTNAAGASVPIIPLRNDMVVENLSCTNFHPNRAQAFVGARYDYGDAAFTNAVLRNISGKHGIDWFMLHQTNETSVTFYNVDIVADWDSILIYNPNPNTKYCNLTIYNSSFVNTGPNLVNPSEVARGLALTSGYKLTAYNSTFIGAGTNAIGCAAVDSFSFVKFYNCVVRGIGVGGIDVFNTVGTPVYFSGTRPSFANCIGSGATLGTPPFDAYQFEDGQTAFTNIVTPINSTLTLTSGDEFSPVDTVMAIDGSWVFPAKISASGTTATITSGTGAPSASEPNGSLYLRTDGGASTTLYIRHTGAWLAK